MNAYPEKYLEGIRLFNEEDFFECHEVLEELSSETPGRKEILSRADPGGRRLVSFRERENLGGARKLYQASLEKLDPYRPIYQGLDVDQFLAAMKSCFQELSESAQTYPAGVELSDERIPRIQLDRSEETL